MPSTIKFKTHSGERLAVKGSMLAAVCYGNQKANLSILVVEGDKPNLFSRDWLQQLKVKWQQINRLQVMPCSKSCKATRMFFKRG